MSPCDVHVVTSNNGAEIYTEHRRHGATARTLRIAFIAHAWGRLGGSINDHVVQTHAAHLHEKWGYSIVLMSARGTGKSTGWPSLTLISEAQDYSSVVEYYLKLLTSSTYSSGLSGTPIEILLCGNSAGSLAAVHCEVPQIADYTLQIGYIIVSYPLSVIWALSLFRSSTFQAALEGITKNPQMRLLSIRGDSDQFTGDTKYGAWETALMKLQRGNICCRRLTQTDHFFMSNDSLNKLLAATDEWLELQNQQL